MSINVFVLQGTICRGYQESPAIRNGETKKGVPWANCRIAVYDFFTKENMYFDVCAFGKTAEILCRCNAGDQITANGRVVIEKFTDRNGQNRTAHKYYAEKIAIPRKVERQPDEHKPPTGTPDETFEGPVSDDDDLPF